MRNNFFTRAGRALRFSVVAAAACVAMGAVAQADLITQFSQDFSSISPVDDAGNPVAQGVLVEQDGLTISGGTAGFSDFTFTLTSGNGATTGNGFIINAPGTFETAGFNGSTTGGVADFVPGSGLTNIDEIATFQTGIITLADGSTGSLTIGASAFNVGGEFLSINSVTVTEHDATGEVTLALNINGFGDFGPGQNENISLSTDFSGGAGGFTNLNFPIASNNGFENTALFTTALPGLGNNTGFSDTEFVFTLREGEAKVVPEPSSIVFLGLGLMAAASRRRRG